MERSVSEIRDSLVKKAEILLEEEEGQVEGLTTTDYKQQALRYQNLTRNQQKATQKSIETRREARLGKQEKQQQYAGTLKQQQQLGSDEQAEREHHEDVRDAEREPTLPVRSADPTVKLLELGSPVGTEEPVERTTTGVEKPGTEEPQRKRSI